MVLVPQERLDRLERSTLQQPPLPTVQTPGDASSRIDASMFDVLNSNIGDREKATIYSQLLQRFRRKRVS